jgi:hypothetical protein
MINYSPFFGGWVNTLPLCYCWKYFKGSNGSTNCNVKEGLNTLVNEIIKREEDRGQKNLG